MLFVYFDKSARGALKAGQKKKLSLLFSLGKLTPILKTFEHEIA